MSAIDEMSYDCESIVSSVVSANSYLSGTYKDGLDKFEEFMKNKEIKEMLNESLTKDEKSHIIKDLNESHESFCANLQSDCSEPWVNNYVDACLNDNDGYETDISEISIEEEVDCSSFVKTENANNVPNLILEDSEEYVKVVKTKGPACLTEKVVVYPKVKNCPNQVLVATCVKVSDTPDLT